MSPSSSAYPATTTALRRGRVATLRWGPAWRECRTDARVPACGHAMEGHLAAPILNATIVNLACASLAVTGATWTAIDRQDGPGRARGIDVEPGGAASNGPIAPSPRSVQRASHPHARHPLHDAGRGLSNSWSMRARKWPITLRASARSRTTSPSSMFRSSAASVRLADVTYTDCSSVTTAFA